MLTEKTGIGPGLLFMLVFSLLIGYGLIQGPHTCAKYLGNAGYWGVILAFILALLVIFIVVTLGRRFPGQSIISYSQSVLGKFFGKIAGLIYLLFILVLMIWTTRDISDHFNIYLNPRTPIWAIVAVILLTMLFLAFKGIEGLTRTMAFLFMLCLMFILLTSLNSFQFFRVINIRPLFHFPPGKILPGIIHSFNIFMPLGALFMIYQYLTDHRKGLKGILGGSALAGFLIFIATLECIGVYGAKGVLIYSWPFLELGKETNIPYMFQTFGLFISPVLLIQTVFGGGALFYAVAQGCAEWTGKLKYKHYLLFLTPLVFIGALITPNVVIIRRFFDFLRVYGFIIVFALPLLIWVMAVVLKKGGLSSRPKGDPSP